MRLKVYRTRAGFAEAIVAAPNQKAALNAWGSRQNLFAEGLADVVDDVEAVRAATAHPGEVLQRAAGSAGPWTATTPAASIPQPKGRAEPAAAEATRKAPPDRSRLTAAEQRLEVAEAETREALADLDRRRKALEREADDIRKAGAKRSKAAERELQAAHKAYRAAGGK